MRQLGNAAMGNGQWAMGNGGIEAMRVMLALQHCGIPALPNCPIAQLPHSSACGRRTP